MAWRIHETLLYFELTRHPITHPDGRAMRSLLRVFERKCYNGLHCIRLIPRGRVTHICHICVSKLGHHCFRCVLPNRHQAVICNNADLLSIVPLRTNFNEIVMEIQTVTNASENVICKMAAICLGLNVSMQKGVTYLSPLPDFVPDMVGMWLIPLCMLIHWVTLLSRRRPSWFLNHQRKPKQPSPHFHKLCLHHPRPNQTWPNHAWRPAMYAAAVTDLFTRSFVGEQQKTYLYSCTHVLVWK